MPHAAVGFVVLNVSRTVLQAAEAANTALAAIANAAATVGNKLAWWGTYLTDIVADVTGDDEVTEEQIQKEEQQRCKLLDMQKDLGHRGIKCCSLILPKDCFACMCLLITLKPKGSVDLCESVTHKCC